MLAVRLHSFDGTDAFVVFDLDGAPPDAAPPGDGPAGDGPAVGVTRLAPKVLRDGAELLARSTTSAFASFELRRGGASAGINARPDGRASAIAAFVAEAAPLVEQGRWLTRPGLGLGGDDLAALLGQDGPVGDWTGGLDVDLAVRGAMAAAGAAAGPLAGARVAVAGTGPVVDAAAEAARAAGATVEPGTAVAEAAGADVDVLLVAGRAGVVDHDLAAGVRARTVVPLTPVPVTARAFAVLSRAGSVYVPDFLSTAAPLLAAFDPGGGDAVERVEAAVAAVASEGTGAWLVAARRAEAFLGTWQPALPFGRPLA